MKADVRFQNQSKSFWAYVKSISQTAGYTVRGKKIVKVPTPAEIKATLQSIGLDSSYLVTEQGQPTPTGQIIIDYFSYRAEILNNYVEKRLMNVNEAKLGFEQLCNGNAYTCPIPMNKQKGDKKAPSYFTAIINMLIEANAMKLPCDFNPRNLTTVTSNGLAVRTLSRWVDGAFPSVVNPIAVWEIKEYYYTTTFGSRVADGVYETLLDGMELEDLYRESGIEVKHYLMVDAYKTWWNDGKSYLCRMIDMIHMGYVDEVLFGSEVFERLPILVKEWIAIAAKRAA